MTHYPLILVSFQKKKINYEIPEESIRKKFSYQVDGEVGRFSFQVDRLETEVGGIVYSPVGDLFPEQGGREWYKTRGFKEIALIHGSTERSYRKSARSLNRMRHHQEGEGTPFRTLQANSKAEGGGILDFMEQKTKMIFQKYGFNEAGQPEEDLPIFHQKRVLEKQKMIDQAMKSLDREEEILVEMKKNPVVYELREKTVHICIDDVVVKEQKENREQKRSVQGQPSPKHYAHNTVAHVQKDNQSYTINGYNLAQVSLMIIGFLLNNHLLKFRLQFLVDGQKTLYSGIVKAFGWFSNIGFILDWYHVDKKLKQLLSSAMNNTKKRNEAVEQLGSILWDGRVDSAIAYLRKIPHKWIKNPDQIEALVYYLLRNQSSIPCYSLRKQLGLPNSSNIGEKMNDLLVADRQKHRGMSWSKDGSVSLATIENIKRNKEVKKWLEENDLNFKLVA